MTAKEGRTNCTNQERWMNLCGQAEKEQDPQKLTEVFAKIDQMLANKAKLSQGPESPAISEEFSQAAVTRTKARNKARTLVGVWSDAFGD